MCGTVFCFSFLLLSDGLCWLSFTLYQLLVRSFNNLTSMLENFIFQDQNWSANVLGDRVIWRLRGIEKLVMLTFSISRPARHSGTISVLGPGTNT